MNLIKKHVKPKEIKHCYSLSPPHKHTHTYKHTHSHTHTYLWVYIYICVCVCVCVYIYIGCLLGFECNNVLTFVIPFYSPHFFSFFGILHRQMTLQACQIAANFTIDWTLSIALAHINAMMRSRRLDMFAHMAFNIIKWETEFSTYFTVDAAVLWTRFCYCYSISTVAIGHLEWVIIPQNILAKSPGIAKYTDFVSSQAWYPLPQWVS